MPSYMPKLASSVVPRTLTLCFGSARGAPQTPSGRSQFHQSNVELAMWLQVTSDGIVDRIRPVKHSKDAGLSSIRELLDEAKQRRRAVLLGKSYRDHLIQCQVRGLLTGNCLLTLGH